MDWHVMASTRDPCSSFTIPKLHGAIPQVLQIFEDKSYSKGWLVLATKILLSGDVCKLVAGGESRTTLQKRAMTS